MVRQVPLPGNVRRWMTRYRRAPKQFTEEQVLSALNQFRGQLHEIDSNDPRVVPVSSVAPFHMSIGDISTAETTQRFLSERGVPSFMTSFWEPPRRMQVIGGGEIIGAGTSSAWSPIKANFLPRGPHILNAVGVHMSSIPALPVDLIQEYLYVSVRDVESQDAMREIGIEAHAVPCPATLQPGLPLSLIKTIPRYEFLGALVEGEYLVVHRHPIFGSLVKRLRRSGHSVVVVDTQAHAGHKWNAGGVVIPPTHSTYLVKGLVDAAAAVISNSLHLAIFAISAGVPFAAVDVKTAQSDKICRYLQRANIPDAVGTVDGALERSLSLGDRILEVSRSERSAAASHLHAITELCRTDHHVD